MIFVYLCTMEQEFASTLLENAVSEFAQLPGIGRKTALRLVLYLLKQNEDVATRFGESIIKLRKEIRYCRVCHNISETDVCPICSNPARDCSTVCVVENVKDVMSIENTAQHHGLYHVLGGLISPMDGIGPQDIENRKLAPFPDVKITILARGVSVGNEIEYTDELTLGRSILNRTLFSDSFARE